MTPDELMPMTPVGLRVWAENVELLDRERLLAYADAWDEDRKSYEVLRSGIRSLWHGVVDGDMDRLSVGHALKGLFR